MASNDVNWMVRSVLVIGFAAALAVQTGAAQAGGGGRQSGAPAPPRMMLTSTAFNDLSTTIPDRHTCDDREKAVSPPLQWSDAPKETASFVLIVHDMDGRPTKGLTDSLHWMVWNIPVTVTQLPEGVPPTPELPDGTRQSTPRPDTPTNVGFRCFSANRSAPHHYVFELFAMDTKLDVPTGAARADLQKAMEGHVIGHATLLGLFRR